MNGEIVRCSNRHNTQLPIVEVSKTQFIDRVISGFSTGFGSYGMGGPGFFALRFDTDTHRKYIVAPFWCADNELLLDGKLLSQYTDKTLEEILIGARIISLNEDTNGFVISCKKTGVLFSDIHEITYVRPNQSDEPILLWTDSQLFV